MCRLMLHTATNENHLMRRLYFNQMLLASLSDGNQNDGVGVTDGWTTHKWGGSYLYHGQKFVHRLDSQRAWMGHVRKASRGTSVTEYEAHPFLLDVDKRKGSYLVAAHNGGLNGFDTFVRNEPNVDSYRAFKVLAEVLKETGGVVTAQAINEWTDKFGDYSEWTFMLMTDTMTVHVVRGNREMWYLPITAGCIANTSCAVLQHMYEWLDLYWGRRSLGLGEITAIEPWKLATFRLDSRVPEIVDINPQKAPAPIVDRFIVHDKERGQRVTTFK